MRGDLGSVLGLVAVAALFGCGGEAVTECVSSRDCSSGMRCVDGTCSSASSDGGRVDAGPRSCNPGDSCDDGVDCTRDHCVEGACENVPDDAACTEEMDGRCVADFGCAYGACSPATCVGAPCQTAHCEGALCVVESMCASDQECCGGTCVAPGCDDSDPCTDDACGATGCESTENAATCDDGVYCNGGDTCAAGTCSLHAGDPCPGTTTCDEAAGACLDCASDTDCPAPSAGPWSACMWPSLCAETGLMQQTITTWTCVSSACVGTPTVATEACTRTTAGMTCADSTFGTPGPCVGFAGDCDETGARNVPRTDHLCAGGACTPTTSMMSETCGRTTEGNSCEDFVRCVAGTCSGGVCGTGGGCPAGRTCCEPGICVCSGCGCP